MNDRGPVNIDDELAPPPAPVNGSAAAQELAHVTWVQEQLNLLAFCAANYPRQFELMRIVDHVKAVRMIERPDGPPTEARVTIRCPAMVAEILERGDESVPFFLLMIDPEVKRRFESKIVLPNERTRA